MSTATVRGITVAQHVAAHAGGLAAGAACAARTAQRPAALGRGHRPAGDLIERKSDKARCALRAGPFFEAAEAYFALTWRIETRPAAAKPSNISAELVGSGT